MENYYTDWLRGDAVLKEAIKQHFSNEISGRRAIVVGSAPNPVFPVLDDDYLVCVNGSAYSLAKYEKRQPHASYLNAALFRDTGAYTSATLAAISGLTLGDVLLNFPSATHTIDVLRHLKIGHREIFLITKYEKRLILADLLGWSRLGFYSHKANISNGIFMAAFCLWAAAKEVVLVGFSFQDSMHAYSPGAELSHRAHIQEDLGFLKLAYERRLPLIQQITLPPP